MRIFRWVLVAVVLLVVVVLALPFLLPTSSIVVAIPRVLMRA